MTCAPGQTLIVKKECVCQHFMHESTKYPREGFREINKPSYTFHPVDEVIFVEEWCNFYGAYLRVKRNDSSDWRTYDLKHDVFE